MRNFVQFVSFFMVFGPVPHRKRSYFCFASARFVSHLNSSYYSLYVEKVMRKWTPGVTPLKSTYVPVTRKKWCEQEEGKYRNILVKITIIDRTLLFSIEGFELLRAILASLHQCNIVIFTWRVRVTTRPFMIANTKSTAIFNRRVRITTRPFG